MASPQPAASTIDTESLAAKAAGGDRGALAALYEHWADPIYRWVLSKTGGVHHTTEDVCQDVWLKAARGIRRYTMVEGSGGFVGWLFTIARRCILDASRAAARRREVLTADMLADSDTITTPGPVDLDTPLSGPLAAAIAALPARRSQVVTLRFFVGLSVEEAATVLGTTPGGIRSLQCRALADIRDHMRLRLIADDSPTTRTVPRPRGVHA